ncbi:hypothetical protein WH50_16100 [Pokkaliibacter plantistimulans]|uniref:Lipoprotein n=2 Tax=Pseudomonadota TaxID=1224 RepID=A0ABX5LVX7_9GAMM|nr:MULTISPECIES: hypothetical protein [Pokkaliibacter]MDH2434670.1 hypothetical protein [Pokkaliibacter sp. MBI-7]PPC76020.1 hypothetical protein C4K68_17755 [Pokkaliibacter plantistimulans]PXF30329.1 hypothetical protein WH50_16100 [Pokkaliibacter plantistimulans]
MKKLVFVSVLAVAGCATQPQVINFWKKDGATYEDAITAEAGCQYKVGMEKFQDKDEKDALIDNCMKMQGYRMGKYPL